MRVKSFKGEYRAAGVLKTTRAVKKAGEGSYEVGTFFLGVITDLV